LLYQLSYEGLMISLRQNFIKLNINKEIFYFID